MKGLLRPQFILVAAIGVALVAWGTAVSAAGSHVTLRSASAHAERSPEPGLKAAEEQNEQAEDVEEANENKPEDEQAAPPAPPPATVTSKTFSLVGGTVTFSCSGIAISLTSAVPNSGFSVETEPEDGGREIKVKFESETQKSEIRATCVGGQVQATEIREESH